MTALNGRLSLLLPDLPLDDIWVQVISLLLLATVLFLASRLRATSNIAMWAGSGCPSCKDYTLVRVHRKPKDRVLALSGIPLGRYLCANCQWRGLRIRKGSLPMYNELATKIGNGNGLKSAAGDGANAAAPQSPAAEETAVAGGEDSGVPALAATASANRNEPVEKGRVVGPAFAKLREEPYFHAPVLARLEPEETLIILDNTKGADGRTWYQVSIDQEQGWVLGMSIRRNQQSAVSGQ